MSRLSVGWKALWVGLFLVQGTVIAQFPQPRLWTIFPPGGERQVGASVQIGGKDLDGPQQLVFSDPRIEAQPKTNDMGEAIQNEFTVAIPSDLEVGLYEVWAIGRFGVSNSRLFAVGDREELVDRSPTKSFETAIPVPLGALVNGRAVKNQKNLYRIFVRQGQRLVVSCFGESLDSRIEPVLELFDAEGHSLQRDRTGRSLDHVAQTTGPLFVGVSDLTFRGGNEYFYRLSIHAGIHADYVLPLSASASDSNRFYLYGRNLPDGETSPIVTSTGSPLERLVSAWSIPANTSDSRVFTGLPHSTVGTFGQKGFLFNALRASNGLRRPTIGHSSIATTVESELLGASDKPQVLSLPIRVSGMFYPKFDADAYEFTAAEGESYWVDLWSSRLGYKTSPLVVVERLEERDGNWHVAETILELTKPARNLSERAFPLYSRDPQGLLRIKKAGRYRATVSDLFNVSRDQAGRLYELQVRAPAPTVRAFSITQTMLHRNIARRASVESLALVPGQVLPLRIKLERIDGFNGPVSIEASEAPKGVNVTSVTIPGGAQSGVILLEADAEAEASAGALRLEAVINVNGEARRVAVLQGQVVWEVGDYNNDPVVTRLSPHRQISLTGQQPFPVRLESEGGRERIWETSVGGSLEIPMKVAREGEFKDAYTFKIKGSKPLEKHEGLKVGKEETSGKLVLDLAKMPLPVGSHQVYLYSEVKGKYQREGTKDAKDLTISTYSAPIRLEVHAAPFDLEVEAAENVLTVNSNLQIPVKLLRRFGFEGQVEVAVSFPEPVDGLSARSSMLRNDQFDLTIEAAEGARSGKVEVELKAEGRLNGKVVHATKRVTLNVKSSS